MPARHGSRFPLEAGFLILLAVLAGLADLRWQAIVLVMGIAWLLIALAEWAFWREGPRVPPVPRGYATWAPPVAQAPIGAPPVAAPAREAPPPPPALPPREEATRIIEPGELAEPEEPEPQEEAELEPPAEESKADATPPPEEPPSRRPWWWRRRESESEEELEPVQPRHVRVLPPEPEREEEE